MTEKKKTVGSMKVEDLMTSSVFAITPTMSVQEAIELFTTKNISGAPVVDQSMKVISVMSQSDLMKFAAQGELAVKISAKLDKLVPMNKIICAQRSDTFVTVFKLFLTNRIRRIIVVDGVGKLQGIISRSNILKAFIEDHKNSSGAAKP